LYGKTLLEKAAFQRIEVTTLHSFALLPFSLFRDEKRLTTAPIRERPKYTEMYKTNNLELPVIRGKNPLGR